MGNPGQGIREKGEGKVKEGRERGKVPHGHFNQDVCVFTDDTLP